MKRATPKIFFNKIKRTRYDIYGPKEQDDEAHILKLDEVPKEELLDKISNRPYKYFFIPIRETLYTDGGKKLRVPVHSHQKIALFGMSIFDLKALELYDEAFKDDFYYSRRRKDVLIIGFSHKSIKKYKTIFFEMDAKILENVVFDIFIEKQEGGYKFYSGSKAGARVLQDCGIKYKKIEYKKKKEDKKVLALKEAMERAENSKMWDELGKICLACGKCTIACPTCFCFDFESTIGPEKKLERTSGNCFFDDFTRIAGGHKFLKTPAEKIKFWYYHKFVRIPLDYGLPGCIDCGRCTQVCPVGIDINKNIRRLIKESKKKR